MQRAWQEFRTGWHGARWSTLVLLLLLPLALVIALAVQIGRGQVPPHIAILFYAGLVGFVGGIAAVVLTLAYWKRLRGGLSQLLAEARVEKNALQVFAGAKGGEVTKRSSRRRRAPH